MIIRKATIEDAPFIALVVIEAVGNDIMEEMQGGLCEESRRKVKSLTRVVQQNDTLYSWQHTIVAQAEDGTLLGAMVAYPGDDYVAMRQRTFAMVEELITFDVSTMDAETGEGEYYLDSLAVMPEARGKGIARQLLLSAMDEARKQCRPAILACEPNNLGAKSLYESLGFRHDGDLFIFGHHYLRMVAK